MSKRQGRVSELQSAWWSRLPDGGVRRVWVTRQGKTYHCQVKITTPAQEAALQRLCGLDYALTVDCRHEESELVEDARVLSAVSIGTLATTSARKALAFLGGDNAALQALIDADPSLRAELS